MSLVERLAEKRGPWIHQNREEARWWLNAIADEVRGEAERRKTPGNFSGHFCTVSEWLHIRANPDSGETNDG